MRKFREILDHRLPTLYYRVNEVAKSFILICGTIFVQIWQIKAVDKVTVSSLFMIHVLLALLLILCPRFSEPAINKFYFFQNKYCARISIIFSKTSIVRE